jgi:CHASE3 domain sensor protein
MRVTVGKKITAIFFVILLLLFLAAIISAQQMNSSAKRMNRITEERKTIIKLLDLKATILDKNHALTDILLFGQNELLFTRYLGQIQNHSIRIQNLLTELPNELRTLHLAEENMHQFDKLINIYESENEQIDRMINTYRAKGKTEAVKLMIDSELDSLFGSIITPLKLRNNTSYQTALRQYKNSIIIAFLFFLTAVILAILIAAKVGKRVVSNTIYLTQSAVEISLGSLDKSIMLNSNDELGELADVLERLRLDIKKAMEILNRK